jgi:hypothetical protein
VTFTALLRMSTPRSMRSRASTPNLTSFADITGFPGLILIPSSRGADVSASRRRRPTVSPFETPAAPAPQGEGWLWIRQLSSWRRERR